MEGDKELLDVLKLEYLATKTELIFEHKKEIERILKKWGVSVDAESESILVDETTQSDGFFYTGVFKRSFFFEKEKDTKEGKKRACRMTTSPFLHCRGSHVASPLWGYVRFPIRLLEESSKS